MTPIERIADRRRRVAAAGIVAVVSVVVAAAAHAAAGGGSPSIVALAVALLVSSAIGMGVVGTRPRRARVAVGVALDQALFHTLFAFFGTNVVAAGTPVHAADAHAGHAAPMLDAVAAALVTALARVLEPVATEPVATAAPRLTPTAVARPVLTAEPARLPDRRGPPALVAR